MPVCKCGESGHDGAGRMSAYDFVFAMSANGQQLKRLTVIDEYTREALAIEVAGIIRCTRFKEVFARLISVHGAPTYLRSDNGPEFVARAVLAWLTAERIDTALIEPGKPWQNGMNESFTRKFRDVCLWMEWLRNRIDGKIVIESWRKHYNEDRVSETSRRQSSNGNCHNRSRKGPFP